MMFAPRPKAIFLGSWGPMTKNIYLNYKPIPFMTYLKFHIENLKTSLGT
jgi:hypothetical protein